jgi:hypothetical protein
MTSMRSATPARDRRAILRKVVRGRDIVLRSILLLKAALAGGFLQLGTGRLNEIEHRLVKSKRASERMTGHHDPRATMPLTLMIESELNLGADPEWPLGQEADSLGRPLHLFLNQID